MSFYKEQIPTMIDKYKKAMEQCLDIVDQEIDSNLSDDKLHSALKGKKMAAEDAKWYAKEVDILQAELSGKTLEDKKNKPNRAKLLAQDDIK